MTGSDQAPVGVVLAAGTGSRFGGPKQLAVLDGRPLVGHVVTTMLDAGLDVLVVVGPHADAVGAAARAAARPGDRDRVTVVEVEPIGGGMGTSLAAAAAAAGMRPLVVALADQPGIHVRDVVAVVAALRAGAPAARIRHPDGPGHPVGFAVDHHDDLVALAGTAATGRDVLASVEVRELSVSHARPPDVDTREDLRALTATWTRPGPTGMEQP